MSRAGKTGNIVSGVGHAAFIGWVLFGGLFTSRPDPVEVREAAMISGEEFQALMDAARQPQEIAPEPVPAAPEVTAEAPEIDTGPQEPAAPEITDVAEPAEEPVEELAPQISEAAPERPEPPAEVTIEDAPVDDTPVERQAEVIAPTPAPEPTPEAVQEPEPQEAVIPEETGETIEQPQDATETPQASDRIVTEAAQPPASAPDASLRPPARRPSAPAPVQTAEQPVTPAPQDNAIADAATQAAIDALTSSASNTVPTGPPMSSGEKDALRLAVQGCWNVDPGARWAQTTVTVAMNMTQDGRVVQSSLRMIASEGGDSSTANAAFGAARRAILLCQKDGYPLPPEKFGQWQEIEMTFNPERMRIR